MNEQQNHASNICLEELAAVEVKCKEAKLGGLLNKTHAYNQIIHALVTFMVEMNISGCLLSNSLPIVSPLSTYYGRICSDF